MFKRLSKKAVVAKFDQDHVNSDGGAILLKARDEKLELSGALAACLSDECRQSKVAHSLTELFQQRLSGIVCGYADGNDAARLAEDPVMNLLAGRDPTAGGSLASQPTLSRFENAVRPRDKVRLSEALADTVIAHHKRRKKRVRRITIDLDPTVDSTHDGQQLTFSMASTTHRVICRWRGSSRLMTRWSSIRSAMGPKREARASEVDPILRTTRQQK